MRTSKNVLSLTIILAMTLSNVIDIKESQACPGTMQAMLGVRKSLQSSGISLSIKIFIDNIQLYFRLNKLIDLNILFIN